MSTVHQAAADSGMGARQRLAAVFAVGGAAAFLLCGYEFVRAVASSLFIGAYGSQRLWVVMALGPVATVGLIYGYGWLLSRFGARRALLISSLASAGVIAGCYAGLLAESKVATAVLYVFREAYIVVLVEQYWSFINSTVPDRLARRVNGPITGFGSIGAIVGASVVKLYAKQLGSETMLLFAVASMVPACLLSDLAYRLSGEPQPAPEEAGGRQGHLALGLFARHPYLVLLAVLIILTQVVSTALDLRFSMLVEEFVKTKDERTAFFGGFYRNLNIAAFALQFGVAPWLVALVPLRVIHGVIPLIHVAACTLLAVRPSLATGTLAFTLFKAFDYSLFRAAKEVLYIPLSFDERYRAKSVIDAFGYRLSKGGASALLGLAASRCGGALPMVVYPVVAATAAAVWLPVVLVLTAWRRPGPAAIPVAGPPAATADGGRSG